MTNVENFRRYLKNHELDFDESEMEDGEKLFRLRQSIKNGNTLLIAFVFSADETVVDVRVFNIATIDDEEKRPALLEIINEINLSYRYPKFTVDNEGEVAAQYSINVEEARCDPESIFFPAVTIIRAVDEYYPRLMRLLWT